MKVFENFTDFRINMDLIPEIVALDVLCRINDFVLSGGDLESNYVKKQLKFASQFIDNRGANNEKGI